MDGWRFVKCGVWEVQNRRAEERRLQDGFWARIWAGLVGDGEGGGWVEVLFVAVVGRMGMVRARR
jgi:hypothetical protein